jgi:Phage Tail Collar Domain/Collagen triple helix repeat (20 copies)
MTEVPFMPARLVNLLRRQSLALVALFIALGGTSFAVVARDGQGDGHGRRVILGCVGKNTGTLRVVDSFIRCGSLETPIAFNREGRRGKAGHRGRPGASGTVGATGLRGPDGRAGARGATGADGVAGLEALTATAAEPAGADCGTGGVKLMTGIDADRNGTLDPGEMNNAATRYVCNGGQGDQGDRGEKGDRGDKGEPGDRGATGEKGEKGVQGEQGTPGAKGDKGDKGVTGDPGAKGDKGDTGSTGGAGQSVTAATEAPGANCAAGGVRYTAASGTSYVCNGAPGGGGSDTAAQVLGKLTTVDGSGSGVDADTLDGIDSNGLVRKSEFGGLFDNFIGGMFGTDDSTASNGNNGAGNHYMTEVYLTAATYPPPGTAFAAGQELTITGNPALFSLLGTTYGGNGTTTFRLPDLRRQAPGGLHYVVQTSGVFPSRP